MPDNKVVRATTTEKVLRIEDKLLKKISDKAHFLRLKSDQTLMRQILEEYFDKNTSKNKDAEMEKLRREVDKHIMDNDKYRNKIIKLNNQIDLLKKENKILKKECSK